jgi:hypothetical protein
MHVGCSVHLHRPPTTASDRRDWLRAAIVLNIGGNQTQRIDGAKATGEGSGLSWRSA